MAVTDTVQQERKQEFTPSAVFSCKCSFISKMFKEIILKNLEKKTVTEKDDYYDVFITCSWMFGSQHNKLIYVNRFL